MDFILSFFRQGGDLGGLRLRSLDGVQAVGRGEEAEPVGRADGLFQMAHFVHEFLNGLVAFDAVLLNHLYKKGEARTKWNV